MFNEDNKNTGDQGNDRRMGQRRRGGPGHGHVHGGPGRFRGGPGRRDGRRQRGDVRAAVLVLLEEQPRNGYQLIQELAERSNEARRPSPGSSYPVLRQREGEGLVGASAAGTGRTYELTAAGRALVPEQREQLGKPWESADLDFAGPAREVVMAARQVLVAGSPAQVLRATSILTDTR